MKKRVLQGQLIAMKQTILDKCIAHTMTVKEGAEMLHIHPKSFSRLKTRYIAEGVAILTPKKPGPKVCSLSTNKTSDLIEDLVITLANKHPQLGPLPLSEKLFDDYGITLNQTTCWRILKRNKIRYCATYKRWKQDPKLYCLDTPGLELQMDACYPFGRSRKLVEFDAIDDCSRYVAAKIYDRETANNAIAFVDYLIKRSPFQIQRIRVDNRYGKTFVAYCATKGIEVIENDPYTPEQNGKIERFHKTVKREFYWR